MPSKKKSWREKLADDKDLPKVAKIEGKMTQRFGTGVMVVPAPREVDAVMRDVPRGKLITIAEVRARLAAKHKADVCCPMTAGIFAWIAAHAAAEGAEAGEEDTTPYWRTLKTGGQLNPKYPGGIDALMRQLEAEGHAVFAKGKNHVVADYEAALAFSS